MGNIIGTAFADDLIGTVNNDLILGYEDNDTIQGGDGNDSIEGGDGNDFIFGANKVLHDLFLGMFGNIRPALPNYNINYNFLYNAVPLNMVGLLDEVEHNVGNDTLSGGNGNDYIDGGPGIDVINGGAGNDTLYGGRDAYDSSPPDTLTGGIGTDFFVLASYLIPEEISNVSLTTGDFITDFKKGTDFFVLQEGVTYDNLSFSTMYIDNVQGIYKLYPPNNKPSTAVPCTLIGLPHLDIPLWDNNSYSTREVLAFVKGITANQLNSTDFVTFGNPFG